MPSLIEQHAVKIEWADIAARIDRRRPRHPRQPGWHLSGVLRGPLVAAGELKLRGDEPDGDEMPLCMAVGMAWEDWVVGLYPDIVWQPDPVECDGVWCSPDGVRELDEREDILEGLEVVEFKATWMSLSAHADILRVRKWMWQIAGYCHAEGAETATLHVLWVAGTYKPPTPVYMTYRLAFPAAETERFWKTVVCPNREIATKEEGDR